MSAGNRIRGLIGAVTAAGLAAVVIGLQPVPADSAPQMSVPSLSVQVKPSGTSASVPANAGVAGLPSASVRAGTNSGVSLQTGASVLPPISAAAQAGPGSAISRRADPTLAMSSRGAVGVPHRAEPSA